MNVLELRHILKQQCSENDLKQWFDPLQITCDDSQLTIVFPHIFFMKMFMVSHKEHLEHAISQCFGDKTFVAYNVATKNDTYTPIATALQPDLPKKETKNLVGFESFLVNHKNYFPLASAQEVATQASTVYNPFVLYGRSGCGKTHLCKAILRTLEQDAQSGTIFWGTFTDLHAKLADTAASGDLLHCDVLIIDDFHHIASFQDCQQDFLSLFNAFHEAGKQIVLATSQRIQTMDFLEPALKSRLTWGLMVTLKRPDLDIRLQFIKQTCGKQHINLSSEQMLTLAQHFADFRSLQGCLLKILAFQNLISPNMAQEDFLNIIKGLDAQAATEMTHEIIIAVVADHLGVPASTILSSTRRQEVVFARQAAMYLCRKLLHYSFPHIGTIFGGKDHSTVIYACRKIDALKAAKPDIRHQLDMLNKKCRQPPQTRDLYGN